MAGLLAAAVFSPSFWAPLAALGAGGWIAWSERRRIAWRALALGLAFQGTLMAAGSLLLARSLGPAPWLPDESLYLEQIARVADAWGRGEFPRLNDGLWLGSLHTAYQRIGAVLALAGLEGRGPLVALNLLALAGAFAAFGLLAAGAFGDSPEGARRSREAQKWFFFFPSHAAWSVFALRDPLHLFVLVLLWVFLARGCRKRGFVSVLGGLGAFCWLFECRIYSAGLSAGAWAFWLWLGQPPRRKAFWAGALALGGLAAWPWLSRLLGPAMASFLAMLPSAEDGASALGVGAFRLLLGPYGWVWIGEVTPDLLLYPGQWTLYLALLPMALAGGWGLTFGARGGANFEIESGEIKSEAASLVPGVRSPSDSSPLEPTTQPCPRPLANPLAPLLFFYLGLALLLILAYGGLAFRQRWPWTVGLCLLAPAGREELRRRPRWLAGWIAGLLGVIALRAAARAW